MLKWKFYDAEQKQDYALCFAIVEELYLKGLSISDIAYLLDVSRKKVSNYLKGSTHKKKVRVIENAINKKGKIKNIAKAYVKARADAQRWRFRYNKALERVEEYKKQHNDIARQLNKKEKYIQTLEGACARMAETNKKNNERIHNLIRSRDLYMKKVDKLKKRNDQLKEENQKLKKLISRIKKFKLLYPSEVENMLRYYEEDKFGYLTRSLKRIANRPCGEPLTKHKYYADILEVK